MERTGLVFAGGGAKGAYQIGVWDALNERGFDRSICAVSGTSIGALNGYLFAEGDLDKAYRLWEGIKEKDILNLSPSHGQLFSREAQKKLFRQAITDPALDGCKVDSWATCFCAETGRSESFLMNGLSREDEVNLLCATSAIPGAFNPVQIGIHHYYDGGMGENVPVSVLYNLGIRNIIVVYLARRDFVKTDHYPGARFLEIVPSENLGNFFHGTMNFDKQAIFHHLTLGYLDCATLLSTCDTLEQLFTRMGNKNPLDTEPLLKKQAKALLYKRVRERLKNRMERESIFKER